MLLLRSNFQALFIIGQACCSMEKESTGFKPGIAGVRSSLTICAISPEITYTTFSFVFQEKENDKITFYLKGADVVMAKKVGQNDWLDEQATDLAKEGLRTLIVAKKNLTEKEYDVFRVRGRSVFIMAHLIL